MPIFNNPVAPISTIIVHNGTDFNDTLDDLVLNPDGSKSDRGTDDEINGLLGKDRIMIYNGNDIVNGGEGSDTIYDRGIGNDVMNGGGDNDSFIVGLGNDTVNGGTGVDSVSYQYSQQIAVVDLASGTALSEGFDTLISIENAFGSFGNDVLLGSGVANNLSGSSGDDRLDGQAGNDLLSGMVGNDILIGGSGLDTLHGNSGNDTMEGGTEADLLFGGSGLDVMTGSSGADRFLFSSVSDFYDGSTNGWDAITDFERGRDKIDVSMIDARPDITGNQAFTFDGGPDGGLGQWWDDAGEGHIGDVDDGSPQIDHDPGEIEFLCRGGYTYVYLQQSDGLGNADIRLNGEINLTAVDFTL